MTIIEARYEMYRTVGGLVRTAKILGISSATLWKEFKAGGLPLKPRGAQAGEANTMKRPEVQAKFLGDLNPSKRLDVRRKIHLAKLGARNGTWKGGRSIGYYRRIGLKPECESCGSRRHLQVHHLDKNRANNNSGNLKTLCARCHVRHHRAERG